MSELIDRLKAAIDEDERIAKATESGEWEAHGSYGDAWVAEKDGHLVAAHREVYPECAISLDDDVAVHIARHDPARVLRQVKAHRTILSWALEATKMCEVSGNGTLGHPGEHMMGDIGRWTIEALAEAYGIEP